MIRKDQETVLKGRPDAVPTSKGWVCPKTGELLVSIKNLPNALDIETVPRRQWIVYISDHYNPTSTIVAETVDEVKVEVAVETVVPEVVEKVKPVKKTTKKTTKKSTKKTVKKVKTDGEKS